MEKRYDYITPNDYATAEENGISEHALYQRVRIYGWDVDRAITQPMTKRRKVDPVWNKWERVATENVISKSLFNQRIKASGWSDEKAATTPVGKGTPIKIKWTDEEIEIAKKNGLDKNYMNAVRARISLGWTREEALSTPILTEDERAVRVAEGTRKYHRERGGRIGRVN